MLVVPLTLALVFLLLYLTSAASRDADRHGLAPLRAGRRAVARLVLGFNLSVAVAVGFIALAGVAAETGVVMLIYLDNALKERRAQATREKRSLEATTCTRPSWSAPWSACAPR